jgi:elongation factor P
VGETGREVFDNSVRRAYTTTLERVSKVITANDLRKGIIFRMDGDLYVVVSYQHVKPGKGPAFVRTKIKNLKKESTVDKTFRPDEKIEDVFIERRKMQYLYDDGDSSVFMDTETYEQETIPNSSIQEEKQLLKENEEVEVSFFEDRIISVDLPTFVQLKVTHTEPGLKGDTATTTYKPATVETGAVIQVPLFVDEGDIVKVDTRTGEYVERL